MDSMPFKFNIAFTLEVNKAGATPTLSASELWQGIKRGGRNPDDFADYVAACEVLSGGSEEFRRRLTMADGAVHTAQGAHLDQDVLIADDLHVSKAPLIVQTPGLNEEILMMSMKVMATTVGTGARSTFLLSYGAGDEESDSNLFLTAMYELRLANIVPGSPEAKEIEINYRALARGACRSAVEKIRIWQKEGKLAKWREDDGVKVQAKSPIMKVFQSVNPSTLEV